MKLVENILLNVHVMSSHLMVWYPLDRKAIVKSQDQNRF